MKSILYLLSGFAAAAAYILVTNARKAAPKPVEELAHKLQDAWADHHTVV
jgi:hypothetical protein